MRLKLKGGVILRSNWLLTTYKELRILKLKKQNIKNIGVFSFFFILVTTKLGEVEKGVVSAIVDSLNSSIITYLLVVSN